jgi:hypothetical protein
MMFNVAFSLVFGALAQSYFVRGLQLQDEFTKCYNEDERTPAYYRARSMTKAMLSRCAIICLPDKQCAGFDLCFPRDENKNDNGNHICRLRNETQIETCVSGPGGPSPCKSYRRVSIKHK